MSNQITEAFVNQYTTNVELLLQQRGSKLRKAVMENSYTGKGAKAVEQIGAVEPRKRTSRHADTPLIETPHDARWVYPEDYEWADLIDDQDKVRMLIDPQSAYAKNGAYAMGRGCDDEIIAAFFATSATGENGTDTEAFDTTNYSIAVGGTGMTVDKLRGAMRRLEEAEVDVENDPLWVVMGPRQHENLLNETQAISLDYNTRPVLVDGKITAFMGFNFIVTTRLQTASGDRLCAAWAQSGMALGIWNDITTKISERADKSYATQVYCKVTCGATRVEQGKVIRVICDEP